MVGKSLGHYEILEPLGKGGMGEVYRARDTNLKRDVALKVLPEQVVADEERLARLEREAHMLAAMNHPNIATIYSLEEIEGKRFLVLELAEGETLEHQLAAGALDLKRALEIGLQIAKALEAAHGKGIIHRDLKPSNISVAADGTVKVLDFGLAKPVDPDASDTESRSPTVTFAGTQAGVVLGTVAYMSPEQARGEELDKRSDIWSFGCVLYEMLAGSRPFAADTVAETHAAILEREPNWNSLPSATPGRVRALLTRCLQKDPGERLHDFADARVQLDDVLEGVVGLPRVRVPADFAAAVMTRVSQHPAYRRRGIVVALGILVTVAVVLLAIALWSVA